MANTIPNKAIAKDEVAKHNAEGDCWLIIHGAVCDVTDWIQDHPGGGAPLLKKAGADATMVFKMSGHHGVPQEMSWWLEKEKEKIAILAIGYLEGGKLADDLVVAQPEAPAVGSQKGEVSCFAKIISSICGGGPTEEEKAAATKALIVAAKAKDAAKCKAALKGGADVNAANADFFNYTALHLFAGQGDLDTVSTLMGYGAEIDPRSESMETPLLMAARAKHKEVVDYLLENGADTKAETNYEAPMRKSAQKYIDEMLGA